MTMMRLFFVFFFFSSRRRHTRLQGDWSSDVCSSDLVVATIPIGQAPQAVIYVPDAVPTGAGTAGLQPLGVAGSAAQDRKSTRLNSSHLVISYAVFCLKKKKKSTEHCVKCEL